MHPTPRRRFWPAMVLTLLAAPPMLASLAAAVLALWQPAAWTQLWQQPQLPLALLRSLGTGTVATALALWVSAALLGSLRDSRHWSRVQAWLAPLLAVPHAAMAIAVLALLASSGWLLRLTSPWATGWHAPPPWPTTQDPWGLGLVLVLVAKEVPFLLWAASAQLARPDIGPRLARELRWATTLGYSRSQAWWRVGWPQLLPRLGAPLLAVLAYSLTVVDVAWLAGPASPPTLAVLAWQWLQDTNPAIHALGAVAAWLLALCVLVCAAMGWAVLRAQPWRRSWVRGWQTSTPRQRRIGALGLWWVLLALYGACLLALALGSAIGVWPFPALLPEHWSLAAWNTVLAQRSTLTVTAVLALAASMAALLWTVAWLEWAPQLWQRRLSPLWALPLALPALLWVLGLHQWMLRAGMDGSAVGLWLAHTLSVLPYTLLTLQGPYLAFDPRLGHVAASLGQSQSRFLLQVKWPLLRAPLLAALAVGIAVSVAQYLPTLYIGAGRFATVTTEAVAQASGGQRALAASFAWLQWLLPWTVFGLAAWAARHPSAQLNRRR
ncbi:ABC transporter permease [Curvibacter sp. APW13]|uniref:ABC transporter permease n=1 Tax=Curvibacter sp. APW13 TaxID=3077236 RepID=UPI0028DE0F7A|nr:ABC transporter permease [Curvibacter sp. APW13]MDT8992489.1 ABC transporter permease [Curvibacter sp. APW13]